MSKGSPISEVGCSWPLCGHPTALVPFTRRSDGKIFYHCPPHDFLIKILDRQENPDA